MAWSVLHFNQHPHADIVPSDINFEFLSIDQNAKLDVAIPRDDLAISASIFASYLFLAHRLKAEYNLYKQGNIQPSLLPLYSNAIPENISGLSNTFISTAKEALKPFPST